MLQTCLIPTEEKHKEELMERTVLIVYRLIKTGIVSVTGYWSDTGWKQSQSCTLLYTLLIYCIYLM